MDFTNYSAEILNLFLIFLKHVEPEAGVDFSTWHFHGDWGKDLIQQRSLKSLKL